jgi:hypothetical protein
MQPNAQAFAASIQYIVIIPPDGLNTKTCPA